MQMKWHETGTKTYETGTDRGALYLRNSTGEYVDGVAWQGLTSVTQSPSGAEVTKQYADNRVYLSLMSVEEFGCTIECFTYPDEFGVCNGEAEPQDGVYVGQQARATFGFVYRTLIGNDVVANNHGYKLNLVYGALASASDKAHQTVNDSPEAMTFSYEVTTTPVDVPGLDPAALLVIDSTKVDPAGLAALEAVLYGTESEDPRLPLPEEVFELIGTTPETPTPDEG